MVERAVVKRSVTIKGHRTSISLESPFWDAIREIAEGNARSIADIVAEVDAARAPGENLSSALRCHLLAHYRAKATR